MRHEGTDTGMVAQPLHRPEQAEAKPGEPPFHRPDAAASVVLTMRQLGVPPLPRNYELFYEAITAGRRDLTEALTALGGKPTQKQLDDIAQTFLNHKNEHLVDEAHGTISRKLDEIITLLRKERSSMETFGQILNETSTGLSNRQTLSREFLQRIISVTATATRTSLDQSNRTVTSIKDTSGELQEVKARLEEYKRLAETDPMTQLGNRRAFDRMLAGIYESKRDTAFSAMILVDIDRFKSVNDRYGHPVGDRIIQIVANIIRASLKEGAFAARTGGEEFAIILHGCGEDATARLADGIRQTIMDAPFVNVANGINYGPISVSAGVCMASHAQGADDFYAKTDRALYASKAAGRNTVTRYSSIADGNFAKSWLLYRKG